MKIKADISEMGMPTAYIEWYREKKVDIYPLLKTTEQKKIKKSYQITHDVIISREFYNQIFPQIPDWILDRVEGS